MRQKLGTVSYRRELVVVCAIVVVALWDEILASSDDLLWLAAAWLAATGAYLCFRTLGRELGDWAREWKIEPWRPTLHGPEDDEPQRHSTQVAAGDRSPAGDDPAE